MNTATRSSGRTLWVATRALLMFTVVLGIGYTLLITGIGQLAFPAQANGSSLTNNEGDVVGSSLIGQSFNGTALPLVTGFFTLSVIGLIFVLIAERGKLFQPHNKPI